MPPPEQQGEAGNNAGAAAELKYIQEGIQLHIEPFHIPKNKLNFGTEWEKWRDIYKEPQLQKAEDSCMFEKIWTTDTTYPCALCARCVRPCT